MVLPRRHIYKDSLRKGARLGTVLLVSGCSVVTVMQSADSLTRNDATAIGSGGSTRGRSLSQSEMRSILVVVADVFRQQPLQMLFVQGNHVI